jgi:sarcosine/dimethylglycine N-methyltransferase
MERLMDGLKEHYPAHEIEARLLAAIRIAGLDPDKGLAPEDLGALDHLHTGGRRATLELLELVPIQAHERALDVGAGVGGPARLLARARGCHVVCLELSPDYCTAARFLNRLTGLEDRVEVQEGSALDLPFPEASFDLVWMQNVGMNIADKPRLYAGVRRVLKPGGRFAFQEIVAGEAGEPYFPLPWATDPADSFLVPVADLRAGLEERGFVAEVFEDTSDAELRRPSAAAAPGPLTMAVFVDGIAEKVGNSRRSLQEGRTRLVRGVFRAA